MLAAVRGINSTTSRARPERGTLRVAEARAVPTITICDWTNTTQATDQMCLIGYRHRVGADNVVEHIVQAGAGYDLYLRSYSVGHYAFRAKLGVSGLSPDEVREIASPHPTDFPSVPLEVIFPADETATAEEEERPVSQLIAGVVALDHAGEGRKAARLLLQYVEQCFLSRDFEGINELLRNLDPAEVGEVPVVALLRSTWRASQVLPAWGDALVAARRAFDDRRLNTKGLLVGLDAGT